MAKGMNSDIVLPMKFQAELETLIRARYPIIYVISSEELRVLNAVLGVTAAAAVAVLVLNYGFRQPPIDPRLLHQAGVLIVVVFALDRLLRVALSRRRLGYIRQNIVDFMREKRPILDEYIKGYFARKGVDIDELKERVALNAEPLVGVT